MILCGPKETNLYLYGSVGKEDPLVIERAISALNEISPNINIKIAPSPAIEPHNELEQL